MTGSLCVFFPPLLETKLKCQINAKNVFLIKLHFTDACFPFEGLEELSLHPTLLLLSCTRREDEVRHIIWDQFQVDFTFSAAFGCLVVPVSTGFSFQEVPGHCMLVSNFSQVLTFKHSFEILTEENPLFWCTTAEEWCREVMRDQIGVDGVATNFHH